jgi:hypothetical protein
MAEEKFFITNPSMANYGNSSAVSGKKKKV